MVGRISVNTFDKIQRWIVIKESKNSMSYEQCQLKLDNGARKKNTVKQKSTSTSKQVKQ